MGRLLLDGKDVGFKFSAAHLLPGHSKCGRMHGHNYVVDVAIEKETNENGMIVDFIEVKKDIREFLNQHLDHKLLIAGAAPDMEFEQVNWSKEEQYNPDDGPIKSLIIRTVFGKEYTIPKMDIAFLSGWGEIKHITAEELVVWMKNRIYWEFAPVWGLKSTEQLQLILYEDDGQGVGTE